MEGSQVSNVFYRYIRPTRFDETRLEFNTYPKGGVCLRFEETPEGGLWFSHSRCHPDDHFNKAVARKVADERARIIKSDPVLLSALGAIRYSQDASDLAMFVFDHCREWDLTAKSSSPMSLYLKIEWLRLADALEHLLRGNHREVEKGRIWITAAHAAEMVASYRQIEEQFK